MPTKTHDTPKEFPLDHAEIDRLIARAERLRAKTIASLIRGAFAPSCA